MREVKFHVIDYPQGQILFRIDHGFLEAWSCTDGYGVMIYHFGVGCRSVAKAINLIRLNYDTGNIIWYSED